MLFKCFSEALSRDRYYVFETQKILASIVKYTVKYTCY